MTQRTHFRLRIPRLRICARRAGHACSVHTLVTSFARFKSNFSGRGPLGSRRQSFALLFLCKFLRSGVKSTCSHSWSCAAKNADTSGSIRKVHFVRRGSFIICAYAQMSGLPGPLVGSARDSGAAVTDFPGVDRNRAAGNSPHAPLPTRLPELWEAAVVYCARGRHAHRDRALRRGRCGVAGIRRGACVDGVPVDLLPAP
jgi:hypothetical protein